MNIKTAPVQSQEESAIQLNNIPPAQPQYVQRTIHEELKLKCLGNRNDYLCERQVTKRYRKALEEIKEYMENDLKVTNNTCFERIPKHILNIINKIE